LIEEIRGETSGPEHSWQARQDTPVDVGVLGVDWHVNEHSLSSNFEDCFFSLEQLASWLRGEAMHGGQIVETYGREFLSNLLENYSAMLERN
jgi:hypothetical protein